MVEEVWKDVPGYEGLYKVSSLGEIASYDRYSSNGKLHNRGKKLSKKISNSGYYRVCLCDGNSQQEKTLHRLIASAFIPNPDNLPQVNHKNEDKLDNRVDNLEWCSVSYNNSYGTINERRTANTRKRVQMFRKDGSPICQFESAHEAERMTGISFSLIARVCRGKGDTAGGYKWMYV